MLVPLLFGALNSISKRLIRLFVLILHVVFHSQNHNDSGNDTMATKTSTTTNKPRDEIEQLSLQADAILDILRLETQRLSNDNHKDVDNVNNFSPDEMAPASPAARAISTTHQWLQWSNRTQEQEESTAAVVPSDSQSFSSSHSNPPIHSDQPPNLDELQQEQGQEQASSSLLSSWLAQSRRCDPLLHAESDHDEDAIPPMVVMVGGGLLGADLVQHQEYLQEQKTLKHHQQIQSQLATQAAAKARANEEQRKEQERRERREARRQRQAALEQEQLEHENNKPFAVTWLDVALLIITLVVLSSVAWLVFGSSQPQSSSLQQPQQQALLLHPDGHMMTPLASWFQPR